MFGSVWQLLLNWGLNQAGSMAVDAGALTYYKIIRKGVLPIAATAG
jgi:hypothetical protein